MKIGIVGLGLIGASMAAALKRSGHEIWGEDTNRATSDFAIMAGNVDALLTDENLADCDAVILAVTPANALEWIEEKSGKNLLHSGQIVMDCCGVKEKVCSVAFPMAKEKGFSFVGGHPMAGKQVGGIKNSSADLFLDAVFAIVPNTLTDDRNDIELMMRVRNILKDAGFSKLVTMTPEEHDKIIAFTSQMAHLVSNAYIKSDMAEVGVGTTLSGGAFRDLTRVAYLDENMWTELFMENKANLLSELTGFIGELERYREAIEADDEKKLTELLLEGKKRKSELS